MPAAVELATLTGGRFLLRDVKELERTLTTVAKEMRYQYLIGYVPSVPPRAGFHEWRSIRVTLKTLRKACAFAPETGTSLNERAAEIADGGV